MRRSQILLVVAAMLPLSLWAQAPTATINGRVLDQSRALISGATVDAVNSSTNIRHSTETSSEGLFTIVDLGALFRLAPFSVRDKSLVLLTQGLGRQPFHGRIAVIINECTSSAGEVAAQFAKDAKLAILIGQKTAGLVLGSTLFEVGNGYTLYLPVFGWYSPSGNHTEGTGVVPDISVDLDPKCLAEGDDAQLNKALEILQ